MPNLDELKAELNDLSNQINAAIQANDTPTAAKLQQKYGDVQAQINQAEVEGVTQQIAPSADEIELNGEKYSIDELAADPPSAIILRQDRRQTKAQVAEQASKWINDVQRLRDEYEAKLAEKETANQALMAQVDTLQAENGQLTLERDDALEKRDAAVCQAEEAQAIIAQKDSHLDDLRAQIAVGTKQAIQLVDIESPEQLAAAQEALRVKREEKAKADAEAKEASKIRIYDVQPGDAGTTYYRAKRADNDEAIEIRPYFAINQYVVITDPEELARFRQDHQAAEEAIVESVPAAEEPSEPVVPEIPFRDDETTQAQPIDGVDVGNTGESLEGSATAPVTREEFEALKAEVYEIKAKVANPQPAVWAS